jgi:putative oxidoreductase
MEMMKPTTGAAPRPLIPPIGAYYPTLQDLAWLIVRVVVGGTLLVHGWDKLTTGSFSGFVHGLAQRGMEPATVIGVIVYFNETLGAICLMLGLFTRLVAASIAIELAVITFVVFLPHGYGWTRPHGGWEYPFLWGAVVFAIALGGGGPYSLDRKIGWEL